MKKCLIDSAKKAVPFLLLGALLLLAACLYTGDPNIHKHFMNFLGHQLKNWGFILDNKPAGEKPNDLPPLPPSGERPAAAAPGSDPPRIETAPEWRLPSGSRPGTFEVRLTGDAPARDLTLAAETLDPGLLPQDGLALGGTGEARSFAVTPSPGKWGEGRIRLTATNAAKRSAFSMVRVVVPEPRLSLAGLADLTVRAGEEIAPVRLRVTDEAEPPSRPTFRLAFADCPFAEKGGATVDAEGRLRLHPAKGGYGPAKVKVVVEAADGRTASVELKVTVLEPPPPPLIKEKGAWVKREVEPYQDDFSDSRSLITLASGASVTVLEIKANRCQVKTADGQSVWLSKDDLSSVAPR